MYLYQEKANKSKDVEYLGQFLTNVNKVLPEVKVNARLEQIVEQEAKDLAEQKIPHLLNKVIFNEFVGNPLDFHKSEFHEHTYDIHLVFAGKETYIYQLRSLDEKAKVEADPEPAHDTIFAYDLENFKVTSLEQGEGVIINPNIIHFAGFQVSDSNWIKKCVVKIDQRYAQLFGLA
ncbi:hypothetical protein CKF59_04470 [Psittacicella gerlachiana]|uniref:YhcH/YjgK/YiaL family protein n=1 Tax=Psittacicella gerlachiana TaxID=2028574 RepID=A0A3A1YBI6_9GAMM|nr:hypothetical protein CKF59_04470 [Psittacicella gerlachiana]